MHRLLFAALLMTFFFVAGCRPKRATANTSGPLPVGTTAGPSSRIVPVPGQGETWAVGSSPEPVSGSMFAATFFDSQLLPLIRNYRRTKNFTNWNLQWHEGMAKVAIKHTANMNTLGQTSLVTNGLDPATRMASSLPPMQFVRVFQFVYENPGSSASAFLNQMLANPAMNAALNNPNVDSVAISTVGTRGTYLFGVNVKPPY